MGLQAMKTIRGQLVTARNEAEMEMIMRQIIQNIGKRHKDARNDAMLPAQVEVPDSPGEA